MERLYYRSTSVVDLQAELRERELLAAARGRGPAPYRGRGLRLVAWLLRRRPRGGKTLVPSSVGEGPRP